MANTISISDLGDAEDILASRTQTLASWILASAEPGETALPSYIDARWFDAESHTTAQLIAIAFAPGTPDRVICRAVYVLRERFLSDHADERTRLAHHLAGVREARAIADETLFNL